MSQPKWLGMAASSRATTGIEEQIERVAFLRALDADRLILPDLPLARLGHLSQRRFSFVAQHRQAARRHDHGRVGMTLGSRGLPMHRCPRCAAAPRAVVTGLMMVAASRLRHVCL